MRQPIDIINIDGIEVGIFRDDDPFPSPRSWDNLGTMVCFHSKYDLGDEHEFDSPDEFQEAIEKDWIIKKIYLYDHSGITISSKPFQSHWDSGQVGWIYVTMDKAKEVFPGIEDEEELVAKTRNALENEIEYYDMYLTGDVYGYMIKVFDDYVGGCWGFYGDNHETSGLIEHAQEEARCLYVYEKDDKLLLTKHSKDVIDRCFDALHQIFEAVKKVDEQETCADYPHGHPGRHIPGANIELDAIDPIYMEGKDC